MIKRLMTLAVLFVSATVHAEQLSQYTAIRVQKANEMAQNEQVKQAIALLKETETSRSYDQAFIARMLGVFHWQNGQEALAIRHLEQAVSSGLLQDEQAWLTQRMLADLYLNQQQFKSALKHYYALSSNSLAKEKSKDLWLRIAQAHYQLSEWSKVIAAANKALGDQSIERLQPLSLKLASQLQLEQWRQAIPTIKLLIELQPSQTNWWRQLVGLQLRIGQDSAALDTLSLAKLKGLELSQSDLRMLAQLYAKKGIPERAALQISQLEGAGQDAALLVEQATYWQAAKEWETAISIWQQAAKHESKYLWNVAQLMVQQGHYQESLVVLNKVKGRKADVALAKTRAFYKLYQLENALIEAKRADAAQPSNQAKSWIKYLSQLRKVNAESTS
ncbi:hypothetical protein EJ063_08250 [Vibrio aquaticus]|uniref:Tetratricopeptide repeat protein n=1 Tax=Vibrio aquaticus TaxID=2496559 RepID=A0A3S0PQ43_9VIBR|nr:hypothetical protein [Vibrio aquaticus]RTZ16774.1 hypothetical protein EJ063_08250 [Vibrio aquaticus]